MNILSVYLSKHFRTGGQKRFIGLLQGLSDKGHSVFLIKDRETVLPVDDFKLLNLSIGHGLSRSKSFTQALKKQRYRIGDCFNPDLLLLFGESGLKPVAYLKRIYKVPVLFAIRNNWIEANAIARRFVKFSVKESIFNKIHSIRDRSKEKLVKKVADYIIFQSDWDKKAFLGREKFSEDCISIIPNSIQIGWFKNEFKKTNTSKRLNNILFIGSDDPRKGLTLLLKAFQKLRIEHDHLNLTIVGYFKNAFIERMEEQGLLQNVLVAGIQKNTLSFLQETDLFVIPSLYDSFPNTLLEALFVGVPSIGTNVAGINVMLKDSDLLFESGSEEAIYLSMKPFLNSEYYAEKADWCRGRINDFDFDWTGRWEEVMNSILSLH